MFTSNKFKFEVQPGLRPPGDDPDQVDIGRNHLHLALSFLLDIVSEAPTKIDQCLPSTA